MKCKKYREQIILRHYGELSKMESNKLEEQVLQKLSMKHFPYVSG